MNIPDLETYLKRKKAEKGYLFIPYLALDDPNLDKSFEIASLYLRKGADSIEFGLPFTDPVADGPILQQTFRRILQSPFKMNRIYNFLKRMQEAHPRIPFIIMGYANLFYRYGFTRLAKKLYSVNVKGFVIPDIPYEEKMRLFNEEKELSRFQSWISFVTLTASDERIHQISKNANGFIYLVSVKGTTGSSMPNFEEIKPVVEKIKAVRDIPVMIGFGIRNQKQVSELIRFTDGFIIGSHFQDIIGRVSDKDIIPSISRELDSILI